MNATLSAGAGAATVRSRLPSTITALLSVAMLLAVVGLGVATYLTILHYTHSQIACNGLGDCEYVNSSKYAVVAGMPVALLGAVAYGSMAVLLFAYTLTRLPSLLQLTWLIGLASFAFSMYLTAIELWVLDAICVYCVWSASVMTALFAVQSLLLWRQERLMV